MNVKTAQPIGQLASPQKRLKVKNVARNREIYQSVIKYDKNPQNFAFQEMEEKSGSFKSKA